MTKLTKQQKHYLKEMKATMPNVSLHSFPGMGVTVGIQRTGDRMGRFAVSIASTDETKFRRKVGEFNVLERFDYGNTQPVAIGPDVEGYDVMKDAAEQLATAVY